MNLFKTSLIALAALGLSAAAQAHSNRGHSHGRHRWERPQRVVYTQPRCNAPVRVVYAPSGHGHGHAGVVIRPGQIVIRPGLQVQVAFGF